MTGVLHSNIATSVAGSVAVTVGSSSGNHGYHAGLGIGSASPTSVLGVAIAQIVSIDATANLRFSLSGTTHSQSIFRALIINDGGGAFRKFNSADATFSTGGGVTTWSWGDGSNKVWNTTDASEVHAVQFLR